MSTNTKTGPLRKVVLILLVLFGIGLYFFWQYALPGRASGGLAVTDTILRDRMSASGGSVVERREAAGRLAEEFTSSPWLIGFLTDHDPFQRGDMIESFADLDRAVIAALLQGIPDHAPDDVLLAVANHLETTEAGVYPGRSRIPFGVQLSSARTRPIQEIAREVLIRSTGLDHGDDAELWRQAILSGGR